MGTSAASGGWWDRPVRVMISNSTAYNVQTSERAAEILLFNWPRDTGEKHLRARQAIVRAMEHPEDPGPTIAARRAFEAAAREAGILAER